MTLNQLGYFYQAAVLQHFNQAAEKINISEPSLSRSITALENELGVTLFEKRGRNVTLTKAGEIFLEHVTQILDDVTRASNKMQQIATNGGHIDIAYVSPLAREFIPNTVRSFLSLEQNKNITFHFFQDITSMNIEGLKKGSYDLIFGSYSANEPNIEFIPICKSDFGLFNEFVIEKIKSCKNYYQKIIKHTSPGYAEMLYCHINQYTRDHRQGQYKCLAERGRIPIGQMSKQGSEKRRDISIEEIGKRRAFTHYKVKYK